MAKERKSAGGRKSNSSRRGKNKEKSWEPDSRDLEIYHENCKGMPQRATAEKWGITQQRVSAIVARINDWLVPQYLSKIKSIKADHSERLMMIFSEAMEAWRRSKEDYVSEEQSFDGPLPEATPTKKGGSKTTESKRVRRGQAGGAQYLAEARAALAEIRKIWGADAPIDDRGSGDNRLAGHSRSETTQKLVNRLTELVGELKEET